jgi:hypothetical protein
MCTGPCCCTGVDLIRKHYYDRGIFDQQSCFRSIGCIRGTPKVFAGEGKSCLLVFFCFHSMFVLVLQFKMFVSVKTVILLPMLLRIVIVLPGMVKESE